MLWKRGRRSENVVGASSGGGSPTGKGLGIGGLLIVVVVALFFGKNPAELLPLLDQIDGPGQSTATTDSTPQAVPETETTDFVRAILGSTEDVWSALFESGRYPSPQLVLFAGAVASACGHATSAVGPFYCSGDQHIYLDTGFFDDMQRQLNAPGEFARAYVIAHEVGHHIQNLTGVMQRTGQLRAQGQAMEGADGLSVRQELQADCYAGVWANHAQRQLQWLEAGDIESALNAATAIGDDRLQQQSRGRVVPDSFTHGSSAQRVRWFKVGMETGDTKRCDTFAAQRL
ncbi:MAG: neutral zinc metallopeptidase [Lysobacterales bacterium CG02_land_8_20_14_3_00_62_12]|nr:MAG: neutral zinc metallopeptidase [Xanthomonadales bacterium CG02_land_8_20_14_3_00_62_12]